MPAMKVYLHSVLAAGAAPPEWVHLVPAGKFSGLDGRGPYVLNSAQAVIDASLADGPIAIDENHAIDLAMTTGQPSPARGWIYEMQSRADGIWGRVEWTAAGTQLMSEHAYRGMSPAIAIDKKTGAVRRVMRAALTNTPNLPDLETLHSEQEAGMDLKALRAALGLPETADEAAVLAAVQAGAAATTAVATHSAQLQRIAAAGGLKAADADGLVVELQAQRAGGGTEVQLMAQQVITLQTQLDTLTQQGAKERATSYVDGAIKAGKPIASLRDYFITRHAKEPAAVETEINGLPSLHAGGINGEQLVVLHAQKPGGDDDDWSPEEKMSCEKMGVSKEAFLKNKKLKKGAV
jgi:phage I-like protein